MKKVFYLPIEPLDERYSEQWYRWFPEEIRKQGAEVEIIDGEPLSQTVTTGTFLDVNSTLHYKSEQLKKVARLFFEKKVPGGAIFFVADIEFWGIEAIKYLSVLNKVPVKLVGFCHAGSYTKEDFMESCEEFAALHERAWFNTFDKILVGSEYHARRMIELRYAPPRKLFVTGNPYDFEEVRQIARGVEKKKRVILSNRPDYEKRPNLTLDLFESLKQREMRDWEFIVTTSRPQWGKGWLRDKALSLQDRGIIRIFEGIKKTEYLRLLAESRVMVSNSIEENFGYCVLEALLADTIPVLSNGFSHREIMNYNQAFLFDNMDDAWSKVITACHWNFDGSKYYMKYADALQNCVTRILG